MTDHDRAPADAVDRLEHDLAGCFEREVLPAAGAVTRQIDRRGDRLGRQVIDHLDPGGTIQSDSVDEDE
nr:hypothetical protein [Agromyces laixinhei]